MITDFGGVDRAFAVAIQPNDDKIVVAGTTNGGGGGYNFALTRYNPNGTLDTSFSFDGKVATDFAGGEDAANEVAIQADGKIVAAGYATVGSATELALVRYNADGTLDAGFGTNGKVHTYIQPSYYGLRVDALAIQLDGRIVVAGSGVDVAHTRIPALARYNPDGTLDASFGPGTFLLLTTSSCSSVSDTLQQDGKLVVTGESVTVPWPGGSRRLGTLDTVLGAMALSLPVSVVSPRRPRAWPFRTMAGSSSAVPSPPRKFRPPTRTPYRRARVCFLPAICLTEAWISILMPTAK